MAPVDYDFLSVFHFHYSVIFYRLRVIRRWVGLWANHNLEIWLMGHWRPLEMAPFDRSIMSSYWRYKLTAALSCIISEIQGDIGRKSGFLPHPLGMSPSGYCHNVWHRKGESPSGKKVWWLICLAVSIHYRRVTDIFRQHCPRYIHTRRTVAVCRLACLQYIATAIGCFFFARDAVVTRCILPFSSLCDPLS